MEKRQGRLLLDTQNSLQQKCAILGSQQKEPEMVEKYTESPQEDVGDYFSEQDLADFFPEES